ncbi:MULTISPECIES: phage holin family protein [Mycetocola]|uniref:phage holin family protein n=1 Tax=Mycetocola TaxID=76634 RepID=UPI0004C20B80|nr:MULTISPECIES: phage holin family protein [Mycetocola]
MIRFLIGTAINLGTAALGLLLAAWIIPGVHITASGFIVAVVVFTVAQAILTPFIFNLARKYATPILGGIGLISTFVALFVATLFPGGLGLADVTAWILAPIVVWVVTALGGWILTAIFLKKRIEESKSRKR